MREGPKLLDLFCGAGGAAMGYHLAGFDVVGVDIVPQPDYPFTFIQADALDVELDGFDTIHASPPCKRWTVAKHVNRTHHPTKAIDYPDLIAPTRERLRNWGGPFIMENVPGAPLHDPVILCGSMFDLRVRRHRLFESNIALIVPTCDHQGQGPVVGVYGNSGTWTRKAPGGGGTKVSGTKAAAALGVTWTIKQRSLSQMVPPAYTEHLGHQLARFLEVAA